MLNNVVFLNKNDEIEQFRTKKSHWRCIFYNQTFFAEDAKNFKIFDGKTVSIFSSKKFTGMAIHCKT